MLLVYLAIVGSITTAYGLLNAYIKSDWSIADWLINYEGGFVRRGLPGQVFWLTGRLLHLSPIVPLVALQLTLYAIFFYATWRLASRSRWQFWVFALLFSPATLAFQVLDPPAGFRKETILFAGLGLLLFLIRRPSPLLHSAGLTCLLVVAALSHESLALYAPYYAGAVWLAYGSWKSAVKVLAVPFVALGIVMLLAVSHPGNRQMAEAICSSLGSRLTELNAGICGGSIYYIGRDEAYARLTVLQSITAFHYWLIYPITLVLAMLPAGFGIASLRRDPATRRAANVLLATSACAFLTSIPLFVVGTDWGRWIYMHVVCLMLLLLFIDQRRDEGGQDEAPARAVRPLRPLAVLLLVCYGSLWTLPHTGMFPGRFGYIDLTRYFMYYGAAHQHRH